MLDVFLWISDLGCPSAIDTHGIKTQQKEGERENENGNETTATGWPTMAFLSRRSSTKADGLWASPLPPSALRVPRFSSWINFDKIRLNPAQSGSKTASVCNDDEQTR